MSAAPGWFGKVVMLGDFAHRRLSQSFITVCDQWLSQSISKSRNQLGSRWLTAYLSGPVWRFAWAPGVLDEEWWFGVLMPSVDAVGRYFPLVISASAREPPTSTGTFDSLSLWYAHAGQAALATLQPGASLNEFESKLSRAPSWQDATAPPQSEVDAETGRHRLVLRGMPSLAQWAAMLACPLFEERYAGHSFWVPVRAGGQDSSLTLVPGLPHPDQFALMLQGQW